MSDPIPVALYIETAVINLSDPKASTPTEGPYVRLTVIQDGDEACVEVSDCVDANGDAGVPLRFESQEEILVFCKTAAMLLQQTKGKTFEFEAISRDTEEDDKGEEFDEEYDQDPLDDENEESEDTPQHIGSPIALPGWQFLGSEDVFQEGDRMTACGDVKPDDGKHGGWILATPYYIGKKVGDWVGRDDKYLAARKYADEPTVEHTSTTTASQESKPLLPQIKVGDWVYVRRTDKSEEWVRAMDYANDTFQVVHSRHSDYINIYDGCNLWACVIGRSCDPRKTTMLDGEEYLVLEKGDLIREGDIFSMVNYPHRRFKAQTSVGERVNVGEGAHNNEPLTSGQDQYQWRILRKIKKA